MCDITRFDDVSASPGNAMHHTRCCYSVAACILGVHAPLPLRKLICTHMRAAERGGTHGGEGRQGRGDGEGGRGGGREERGRREDRLIKVARRCVALLHLPRCFVGM